MAANAAVDLPQPDSPTSPYAQHFAVDATHAIRDAQVAQFQGRLRRHSSNASVTPSAIRLMPIASVAIAPAGKIVDHQTPLKMRL